MPAAAALICLPVAVLPVKLIVGTSGERTSTSPLTWPPVIVFATPGGSPGVWPTSSAMREFVCAVCHGRFITAVQPAASAGARERIPSATGEFHGAMISRHPDGLADHQAELAVGHLAVGACIGERECGVEPQGLRRERHLQASLVVGLPVFPPEQLDKVAGRSSNRSAIRFSTRARSSRSVRHAGSRNARLAASIAACASLGPAIAYEPMTSPVAGFTEARCSSEPAHWPSIQCCATDAAVVLTGPPGAVLIVSYPTRRRPT